MPRRSTRPPRLKKTWLIEQTIAARIEETAAQDRRSVNEQVNHLLSDALKRTRVKRKVDQLSPTATAERAQA